jgi:hypothetical protein
MAFSSQVFASPTCLCAALDNHLVMAVEYQHSSGTLASVLPQEVV